MTTRRQERVNELMRDLISEILQTELRDPRLGGLVSVTEVGITADLKRARVYLSVLGDEAAKRAAIRGARAATGYLRRALAERLTLRYVPELEFILDSSLEQGDRINRLLNEISQEEGS